MLSPQPLEKNKLLVLNNDEPSDDVGIGFALRSVSIVPPSVSLIQFGQFKQFMESMSYQFFSQKKDELIAMRDEWESKQTAEDTTREDT